MICKLYILEEAEEIEKYAGAISYSVLQKVVEYAFSNDLLFLRSIDLDGDTIFNVLQLINLKNELNVFNGLCENTASRDWENLINAIDTTLQGGQSTYLRISCK